MQLSTGDLWPLSERGQHLFGEATSHDFCLWAAGAGTQFIGGANRDEFALEDHADLGTELFGLGQSVGIEKDGLAFAGDQPGQVIALGRRRHPIKPGSWLIQEDV